MCTVFQPYNTVITNITVWFIAGVSCETVERVQCLLGVWCETNVTVWFIAGILCETVVKCVMSCRHITWNPVTAIINVPFHCAFRCLIELHPSAGTMWKWNWRRTWWYTARSIVKCYRWRSTLQTLIGHWYIPVLVLLCTHENIELVLLLKTILILHNQFSFLQVLISVPVLIVWW